MDSTLVGKPQWLHVRLDKKDLFYTAKLIKSISPTHITFIDKEDKEYTFRICDIVQSQPVNQPQMS